MLAREELENSGPPGFTVGQKEKDYAQHWVLSYLGQGGFGGVFKGGTCLQKAYALPRYSEDLDFTLSGAPLPNFGGISGYLQNAGFGKAEWKLGGGNKPRPAKLGIEGPLFNGREISRCSLSLDFNAREKILLAPQIARIRPPYPDIIGYSVKVMAKKEMAAEKIHALLARSYARDLYDLHFLCRLGELPDEVLLSEKLASRGMEFGMGKFRKAADSLGRIWKTEISAFAPQVPDFAETKKEVLKAVGAMECGGRK